MAFDASFVPPASARPAGRVLVVDDEPEVRSMVTWQLEAEGFVVVEAADGEEALRRAKTDRPDLLVLDLSLPGKGGLEVLATLRRDSALPVIVLTARRDETDRIVALDLGADDYVVKPFSPRELAARARSVLRRSQPAEPAHALSYDGLVVDTIARIARHEGAVLTLTAREFDLLAYFAAHPMRAFTRAELLTAVWSSSPDWQVEATVTEHVHRLRQKIEQDPAQPRWIVTVRNAGYRFEGEPVR
jgi:two-component system phosphate regulon response regulator PhoB